MKTPYERSRDAALDLIKAAEAYAEAFYEHDTRVRGITPYGSYKDTLEELERVIAMAQMAASNTLQANMTATR